MSPVLEIVVFPPLRDVEVRDHPPMAPEFAVTEPLIVALVAVSRPSGVTLNSAEDAVLSPA